MTLGVRPAVDADRRGISDMLARAFMEDPVVAWIRPDRESRLDQSIASFGQVFDADAAGMRFTTPGHEAASLWRFSKQADRSLSIAQESSTSADLGARRGQLLQRVLRAHMPDGDYWYLHVAGCDPDKQGCGFGTAVVAAGLDRIGRAGVYLETANPDNLPFYAATGFQLAESWTLPEGGPAMWSMFRAPWD